MPFTARRIRFRTLPILALLAALGLGPGAARARVGEIPPVDQAARDPGFFLFRARLMTALAERNLDFVDRVLADGVKGFAAPYLFTAELGGLDAFRAAGVLGDGVRVRSRPGLDGEVLAQLSFVWVEVPDWRPVDDAGGGERKWLQVKLADGRSGYVAEEYLRSPIDYRALFAYREGRWQLEALVAGD